MRASTRRPASPSSSTDPPRSSPLPSTADLELAVIEDEDDGELAVELDEEVIRLESSDSEADEGDRHDRRKEGRKKRGRFSLLELGKKSQGKYSQVTATLEARPPAPTALPVPSSTPRPASPLPDTSPSALSSVRGCLTVFNCCLLLVLSAAMLGVGFTGWAIGRRATGIYSADRPRLVVVSVDGFRPSYFTDWPELSPNLQQLQTQGISAARLLPVFPSSTFPNHWSLVTGLHPPAHGIIANHFYNHSSGEWFIRGQTSSESHCTAHRTLSQHTALIHPPLSLTLALSPPLCGGVRVAGGAHLGDCGQVGSEVCGAQLARQRRRRGRRTADGVGRIQRLPVQRPARGPPPPVDRHRRLQPLHALLQVHTPERRETQRSTPSRLSPHLRCAVSPLLSEVDAAGHLAGPNSTEVAAAVASVDSSIGRIVSGLRSRGLLSAVNVLVVSDHGMASVSFNGTDSPNFLFIDDVYPDTDYLLVDNGANALVLPQSAATAQALFDALGRMPNSSVWWASRDDLPPGGDASTVLPAVLHYSGSNNPLIPPIIVTADEGFQVTNRSAVYREMGAHGFDPSLPDMAAVMALMGAAVAKPGQVLDEVRAVDIYALMCALLAIPPATNEGDLTQFIPLLKH